jgi:hypothetical protein
MVGRLIIEQEKDALTRFQELTKATDADRIGLFRVRELPRLLNQTLTAVVRQDIPWKQTTMAPRKWQRTRSSRNRLRPRTP